MNRLWRITRWLLLMVVAAGAATWLLLRTEWGAGRMAAWAERRLGTALDGLVVLRGVHGHLAGRGGVETIELADRHGVWLVASNVTWEVGVRDLLRRTPTVRRVRAGHVAWLRLPATTAHDEPAPADRLRLPRVAVSDARVDELHIAAFLAGEELSLRAAGRVQGGGEVLRATADVESTDDGARLATRCEVGATPPHAAVTVRYEEDAPGILARRLERFAAGKLVVDATVEGWGRDWTGGMTIVSADGRRVHGRFEVADRSRISAHAEVEGVAVDAGHLRVEPTEVRVDLARGERRMAGLVSAMGRCDGHIVTAATHVVMEGSRFIFTNLQAKARGASAYGGLYLVNGRPSGHIRVALEEPDALAWLSGTPWKALGAADLRIRPERIQVAWNLRDLAAAWGDVRALTGRVVIARTEEGTPTVSADVEAAEFTRPGVFVSNAVLRASGTPRALAVRARAAGAAAGRPWAVDAAGQVHRRNEDATIHVTECTVNAAGLTIAAAAPFQVTAASQSVSWTRTELASEGGRLVTEGTLEGGRVEARVDLHDLALAPLTTGRVPYLEGFLAGHLAVAGALSAPAMDLEIDLRGLRPRDMAGFSFAPADLYLRAACTNGRLDAALTVAGWTEEPARASLAWPLVVSLRPWRLAAGGEGAVAGSVDARLDLSRLRSYIDLRGSDVRGMLASALAVSGTAAAPDVQGRIELRDGAFEFPESGTLLRDVQLVLVGDEERIAIQKARATDGGRGTLALEGHVLFRPEDSFPINAALVLAKAELWRQGGSRVQLDGRLGLTGNVREVSLTGAVSVVSAEIRLARSASRIVKIRVEGWEGLEPPPRSRSAWLGRVKLDLRATGRGIKVTGRGLESEWGGDLRLHGRGNAPRLTGSMAVERGYFLFMGRRFALDRGILSLDGRWPPLPQLSISASSRAGEMVARLEVSGSAGEPSLALDSDPPYPTDEVLSRLLFGKSADSITALQAVRLAYGLEVLRGKGTAMDALDRGQSVLRVDQLQLRQSEESGEFSSVAVGKYIGRSIYVQGEKGLGEAEDVVSVELELTPSLILHTETSPQIREGIGLRWQRDY